MRRAQSLFILLLIPLVFGVICACQHVPARSATVGASDVNRIEVVEFRDLPVLESNLDKSAGFKLGAFSGLMFEGNLSGRLTFKTHTDRGPNAEPTAGPSGVKNQRPFLKPNFQPRWIDFSFDPATKNLRIEKQTLLTSRGRALTGLPNRLGQNGDEVPVDSGGRRLKLDPMGLDLEGLVRADDGTYWMSDEYRPSVVQFSSTGELLKRYIPAGGDRAMGQPVLPEHYATRVANRGFEGVAYRDGVVYAFLQSPLQGEAEHTRILAFDASTGKRVSESFYVFDVAVGERAAADKIGDAVALKDGSFLVLEQNSFTGEKAVHSVYRVRLAADATVKKTLVADLAALGLSTYEKVEGLTIVDGRTLALVTDNDFSATGRGEAPAFILVHLAEPLF